jgi:hypothetical protein
LGDAGSASRLASAAGNHACDAKLRRSMLAVPIALAASALVIALVAYAWRVGWWRANEADAPAPSPPAPTVELPPRSVAVLAFQNLSAEPNSDLFTAGLADTILHQLASLREVKVIAGASSFLFKGRNLDAAEIGRKLAQLRGNPRFQSILTRTRAHVAEQRAILKDMRQALACPTDFCEALTLPLHRSLWSKWRKAAVLMLVPADRRAL